MSETEITIPVGSVPEDALPSPSSVSIHDGTVRAVSDATRSPAVQVRMPDPQVQPDIWTIGYQNVPGVTLNLIRAHHRDHVGPFSWPNPLTAAIETWQYAEPPAIRFDHRTASGSARITLERLSAA